jgi:hypothetical protein
MSLIKIITIIVFIWIIYQIKKFISGIQITNGKGGKKGKVNRKSGMDIQDADYEEVE